MSKGDQTHAAQPPNTLKHVEQVKSSGTNNICTAASTGENIRPRQQCREATIAVAPNIDLRSQTLSYRPMFFSAFANVGPRAGFFIYEASPRNALPQSYHERSRTQVPLYLSSFHQATRIANYGACLVHPLRTAAVCLKPLSGAGMTSPLARAEKGRESQAESRSEVEEHQPSCECLHQINHWRMLQTATARKAAEASTVLHNTFPSGDTGQRA